ncbi:MAG: hypothetical protein ACXVC7_03745 [Bacteroidia bacterium]
MKINCVTPELNLASFYDFAKMSLETKSSALLERATWLDEDYEEGRIINLYFMDGYFVEETFSTNTKKVIDIIPYKRGYKIERFLQLKGLIELKDYHKN